VISSKLFTRKACKLGFTLKLKSVKIQALKPFKLQDVSARKLSLGTMTVFRRLKKSQARSDSHEHQAPQMTVMGTVHRWR
jgi:hypothetical protein